MSQCKFITVFSLFQGDGAKFVATNLAHTLANKEKEKKVVLIDFDFNAPVLAKNLYIKENIINKGIDNVALKAMSNSLSKELFLNSMISLSSNLSILKGTNFIDETKKYNFDTIQAILELVYQNYDYAVIVCSKTFDNAGTILALKYADMVHLVLRQSLSVEALFEKKIDLIDCYVDDNTPIYVIYNYAKGGAVLNTLGASIKNRGISILGELEYDPMAVDNVDIANKKKVFNKSKNTDLFTQICKNL